MSNIKKKKSRVVKIENLDFLLILVTIVLLVTIFATNINEIIQQTNIEVKPPYSNVIEDVTGMVLGVSESAVTVIPTG